MKMLEPGKDSTHEWDVSDVKVGRDGLVGDGNGGKRAAQNAEEKPQILPFCRADVGSVQGRH